jgi:hypothetical protein
MGDLWWVFASWAVLVTVIALRFSAPFKTTERGPVSRRPDQETP